MSTTSNGQDTDDGHRIVPAVLCLTGDRTFGRFNKHKYLYRCLPLVSNDAVLLPFDRMAFLKRQHETAKKTKQKDEKEEEAWHANQRWSENHYVLIRRRPPVLVERLGPVSDLVAFCRAQQWSLGLVHALSPTTAEWNQQLAKNDEQNGKEKQELVSESSSSSCFFSIDPPGCRDIDDALAIVPGHVVVAITNVVAFLDSMVSGWALLARSGAVSTLYGPSNEVPNVPMLPLGASLQADGTGKPCVCWYVPVDATGKPSFANSFLRTETVVIERNFAYDDDRGLAALAPYQTLCAYTPIAQKDSHDVVAYWMLEMNRWCGARLAARGCGVFRTAAETHTRYGEECFRGRYVLLQDENGTKEGEQEQKEKEKQEQVQTGLHHAALHIDAYAQVTSPMRRLGDLVNQYLLLEPEPEGEGEEGRAFVDAFFQRNDFDDKMRRVRQYHFDTTLFSLAPVLASQTSLRARVLDIDDKAVVRVAYLDSSFVSEVVLLAPCRVQDEIQVRLVHCEHEHRMHWKMRLEHVL